ncbi:MAG: amidohydrolase family protein, partial [Vicinamibacteria bacterium]
MKTRFAWVFILCLLWAASAAAQVRDLDLVLAGGRVLDPETGLDAKRDVGIAAGSIAAISERSEGSLSSRLKPGGILVDARGQIVAPGFIDLHAHGQTNRANEFQAHDGVTTALELEGGVGGVSDWIASRKGRALLNYGASVSHGTLRVHAMPQFAEKLKALGGSAEAEIERELRDGLYAPLPEERTEALYQLLEKGLREGGLGIGMPHQ